MKEPVGNQILRAAHEAARPRDRVVLPPAIVLGVDSPIGLTVMRELGWHGVPVHAVGKPEAIGGHSRYCASFTPRPQGPIADWLPGLIARTAAVTLFAIGETDLVALAGLPEVIGGCRLLVPRARPLRTVLDKRETLAIAAALGMDTPQSWQPQAGEDFAARAAALTYPAVAKWADPADTAALLGQHGLDFVKAEFLRTPEEVAALLARYAPLGRWPLIQSYCPGIGLGQMLHMADGTATLTFQHRRLHEWPPEGGVSTWCAAEPRDRHTAQMARSEALLRAIGWDGPAMVEYRHDPATGRYWLMEVNGRFWGSLPLAWQCGAHFAWEQYRRFVLDDTRPAPTPRDGLRARYMIPETRRLARILFRRGGIADPAFVARPLRDLASYVLAFLDPRTRYYVFNAGDIGPSLADLRGVFRKLARRGSRRQGG
jgi:predicted ATP-grasp superfamily ATP-dependent carboligase